jgi:colanic acid biosynthesis glycosyl transferase WcaI
VSRRLLCVYQHAPTPGAPGIYRHRVLLSELVRRGWEVDLVSTPLNYMTGATDPRYAGRAYVRETIDGVVHHWVWASAAIHASKGRRVANYVTFATSAGLRSATLRRPDVILMSSPPLSVAAVGPALAARFRRPWLLEVRDVWPESAVSVGWLSRDSLTYTVLERIANGLAARAESVIVPTPGLVAPLLRHGARRVAVVPGVVRDVPPNPGRRQAIRSRLGVGESTCLFLYLGSIGAANGLETLLDAARLVTAEDIAIVLVGDGSARRTIEQRLAEEPIPSVRLVGAVPQPDVHDWLAASDVCLHMLRPDPVFESALPSKVLEYFGAHRPFVTTVRGLPRRLALASGGGAAEDAATLAAELSRWAALDPADRVRAGEQSFELGRARFGLDPVADRLEEQLVDAVVSRSLRRVGTVPLTSRLR